MGKSGTRNFSFRVASRTGRSEHEKKDPGVKPTSGAPGRSQSQDESQCWLVWVTYAGLRTGGR